MNVTYCDGWFRGQKRAVELLTEDQARAAHNAGKLYAALIDDPIRPRCFVEVTDDSMAVEFLDHHLRSYVCYSFQTKRPGWLFITMATYREFNGDSDEVPRAVIYYYKVDGSVTVHKALEEDTWEANTTIDVSANWERYPEFGNYESIARLDRGLPRID